jgi:hypothetical protein
MTLAAAALSALRGATGVCAAIVGLFSPEQRAEVRALANELLDLFTSSAVAGAPTDVGEVQAPPLPHLPTELLLQIVRHLDVRDLGRMACTCRQLYFGPPCPPGPTSVVEEPTSVVEEELRRRAAEAGRWLPPSMPAGVSGWVPALLQREWRDSLEVGTVAAGISPHSFFVGANGALMVCGFEDEELGTLGLPRGQGANQSRQFCTVLVPTPVLSMADIRIRQVVAGFHGSLALSEAGRVYMWGQGRYGMLATDTEARLVPTMIQELSHHRVRQVAIEHDLCAAVTEEGLLFMWVTAGSDDSYGVGDQRMPIFGRGVKGTVIGDILPPRCVAALKRERVGSVAVGFSFTLVTTEEGAVFSFGEGTGGMLGHGDNESHILPKRIEALRDVHVATVATGGQQSFALTACGRVFWWGVCMATTRGAERQYQYLPQLVDSAFDGGRVRSIAANRFTAYAVTDAGVLFQWGCDSYGHDGDLFFTDGNCQVQLSPWPVAALHGVAVASVSARDRHALILAADGSVYAVGLGRALGIGWGVGGEGYPEGFQGDAADEAEGQMILPPHGERIQLTLKKIALCAPCPARTEV